MPVGHHKITLVLVLQLHPVFKRAGIVTQVKPSRRPVTAEDIYTYDITKCLNIDDKAAEYVWQQTLGTDLLINAPPVDGAVAGLSALDGHEIWIVTGRPSTLQGLTEAWLSQRKIRYDRIIFDRVMNKMLAGPKFDVFVEDFLEGATVIAESGVFTL